MVEESGRPGRDEEVVTVAHTSALVSALDEYVAARDAAVAKARSELSVSELEASALTCIGEQPGIRPSVLRGHLGVTAAGVTTMVDRLIGRGLVRRELDADDRRVNHIYLEVDLDEEPWVALQRFALDTEAAVRGESADAADAAAQLVRRITERVSARV